MAAETILTDEKTGAQKGMKLERWDLMPFDALNEVARVYGMGAQKYDARNWEKGYSWGWSLGALLRHVALWAMRESYDKESGLHHLAHAAWHCLTLITFEQRGLGTDDRSVVPVTEFKHVEAPVTEFKHVEAGYKMTPEGVRWFQRLR